MRQAQFCLTFTTIFTMAVTVDAQLADVGTLPLLPIELRLRDAVFPTDNPNRERSLAIFLLRRSGDNCVTAWGTTRGINHNVQPGWLSDAALSEIQLSLNLEVTVFGDARGNRPGLGVGEFEFDSEVMSSDWIFAGGYKTDLVDGEPFFKKPDDHNERGRWFAVRKEIGTIRRQSACL